MIRPHVVFASLAVLASNAACMSRAPTSSTTVTSAELSARAASEAAQLATAGAYTRALQLADRAVSLAPENPWAHYDRAIALRQLERTAEAVAAFREAEARFGFEDDAEGRWGKSIAIYGRARALDDAGTCDAARAAYHEFAAFVESWNPRAAEMARSYAQHCGTTNPSTRDTSDVSTAVVAGEYERALNEANRMLAAPENMSPDPWLQYNRAVSLAELGRTNEAVASFEAAETFFENEKDAHGRSLAVYGRARALDNAGRCVAARSAYEDYARVAPTPADAEYARTLGKKCGDLDALPEALRRR